MSSKQIINYLFVFVIIFLSIANIFGSVHINTWLGVIATILAVDFIMNDD